MIDIHFHIVPGVDDGPVTLNDSKLMLDMAKADGIKEIIATSHRNHPMDFYPTTDYESSLKNVLKLVSEYYPEMKVYKGAELYIREGYLNILDSMPYDFTLNGTRYVLIEFSVQVDYRTVLDSVYELGIRNFIPVLAHIERYPALFEEKNRLEDLKNEGAYLQITGDTLTGGYGDKIRRRMTRLVKEGFIDFIASDSHSIERRKPSLKGAYDVVEKLTSKSQADLIFIENPRLLLEGKNIKKIETKKSILKRLWKHEE